MTCLSPAGGLWLLLEDGVPRGDARVPLREGSRWLQLETGEERLMTRTAAELARYGWREVEGEGA